MADDRKAMVRLVPGAPAPRRPTEVEAEVVPARVIPRHIIDPRRHEWVGRVGIFELSTGTKVQGKVLAVYEDGIDTDNGWIRMDAVVHARWCGAEEISIIRGGPLQRRW